MDDQQDHIRRIHQEYIQRDQRLFDTIKSHLPELKRTPSSRQKRAIMKIDCYTDEPK